MDMTALADMVEALHASKDYRVLRRFAGQDSYLVPPDISADRLHGLIVDTETTGLDPINDEIIELGMVKFSFHRDGWIDRVIDTQGWFRMPTKPIPEHITALTGITDQMVAGAVFPDDIINAFAEDAVVVIAMNSGFDRRHLEPLFPWARAKAWACGMKDIDWKAHGAPSQNLQVVAWTCGFFYDGHRATMDCQALLHALAQINPANFRPYMAELLENARLPSWRVWAEKSPYEMKDTLKARGYQWEATQKTWFIDLRDQDAVATEDTWLRGHGVPQPSVKKLSALHRYSNRENIR